MKPIETSADSESPDCATPEAANRPRFLSAQDIADAHALGRPLKESEIARFRSLGVGRHSLELPNPVLADRVFFRTDSTFDFAREVQDITATLAFTIAVQSVGGLVDIVAWEPCSNRLGLLLNRAFALGEDEIWAPQRRPDPGMAFAAELAACQTARIVRSAAVSRPLLFP